MLDTPTLQYLIDRLTTINSSDKAITLNNLISSPRIDERLLPYLEQLLTDQSACLISIPYQFGEIRWLAAHVLAKTRAALHCSTPVTVYRIVRPVTADEITFLEKENGISINKTGVEGYLAAFEHLKVLNKLPLVDIELFGVSSKANMYRPHLPQN